ncbi:UPF0711 protein C18orf21 homolog [Fundulus heteroclitus]|uniref:UPF0711 protein C18orf21 homolog n=1 Tax=Fundulus heteroclitus TaxID=8078 RepID=UPI00165CC6B6|nr:UPF0711 protein C18orf21 homolog [Fundulus heteroclitus]XP_021180381.2 UPF0711 protein C18orf21 homolog [Fundulus heteroclitus]
MKPDEDISARFLLDASLLYEEKCPELSRFLLQLPFKIKGVQKKSQDPLSRLLSASVCQYCYQWLKPDNHRVRLRPKRRPSAGVQRVLLRKARGKRLSLVQRKLLLRFQKSPSVLMATCHACNKTSIHKGVNRDFIASFAKTHSTPGSAGKYRTPQPGSRSNTTTPKTSGKDKTPSSTPRSSITSTISGSSSSSSKSSSKSKNWVVQRLSKILTREDSQGKKKGGLKDFLSSL